MDMLSGSQINPFLSATSLVWSSSIVLVMVGIVYFIKFRERHDAGKNSRFFVLYILTILLNIFEYIMNGIMQTDPSYGIYIYKTYILIGFFWNIAIVFYTIFYIKNVYNVSNSNLLISRIVYSSLIIISFVLCLILDVSVVLEVNGKFYELSGSLYSVYNISAFVANMVLLVIVIIFRKKLPRGFATLIGATFVIYLSIFIFKNTSGYTVKETVFVYSLLVLIIFNTTSNQDKEAVNKLNNSNKVLMDINDKKSKLLNKVSYQIGQSLNNLVLYNDVQYMDKEHNREAIQFQSNEISKATNDLSNYLLNVKELFLVESDNTSINGLYQLTTLINRIYAQIYPIANAKRVRFNMFVGDNSFLNYIGDINKIEKAIINIVLNAIDNSPEGQDVSLTLSSRQYDLKNIELSVIVKNMGNTVNINLVNSSIDDYIEKSKSFDNNDLKIIISNKILEKFNSKIDIKTDKTSTMYSFTVIQGFSNKELYGTK